MTNDNLPQNRPPTSRLHPRVYAIMIALACWLVLSVWAFAANGNTAYLLAVISGFFAVIITIPLALRHTWRTWRRQQRDAPDAHPASFREWASGTFESWQDRNSGAGTAVEILLPIAAVSFGMTAFAIAFHIAEHLGIS